MARDSSSCSTTTRRGSSWTGPQTPVTLTTDSFTWFRLRMGRRTRAQVAAMDWSSEPGAMLDRLFVFGPTDDAVED